MKNKQYKYQKEKRELFFLKIKQLVLSIIMTLIVVFGFMIILFSLILFFKKRFD
jgi:hypothetical protein